MIIECPGCGTKNSTDKPLQPGSRYRCGKCGALITFTQTADTQGIFTEVPPKKAPPKSQEEVKREQVPKKRKSGCFGCLGLIAAFIIIVVVINLSSTENPRYIYEHGAIHVGADGKPIELINNPNATNPTYAELVAFIKEDTSDSKVYSEGVERQGKTISARVCADFAEAVHNNAETKGIRVAWVGIDFRGGGDGHAINAFETSDRGLVYVDCTGASLGERLRQILKESSSQTPSPKPTSRDSIAYVEIGKEYGCIHIARAESPSYSFYEEYKHKWQEKDRLLSIYEGEVALYNMEVRGKVYYEGSPELAKIEAWKTRIEEQRQLLDELREELGKFWFEPLGIVEDIHIHW